MGLLIISLLIFSVETIAGDASCEKLLLVRGTADFAGFVVYNKQGDMCFGFGKHKDKKVTDVLTREPGYFGWVLNADFPRYTKKILTEIRLQGLNTK